MADQLLSQVQDLLEGQIVRFPLPLPQPSSSFPSASTMQDWETNQTNPVPPERQDFEGQKLTEIITTVLLAASGVRSSFYFSTVIPSPLSPPLFSQKKNNTSTSLQILHCMFV